MIFDKDQIITAMKYQLSSSQKKEKARLTSSLDLALDDLTMRLASVAMITSYSVDIAKGDRTADLRGSANDLRYIFELKFGSGANQGYLEWVDPKQFLLRYDSPVADQTQPTKYTVLESPDGFPRVKFDSPSSAASTLTVYYYTELTADNVNRARSSSVMVAGALAYFHGTRDGGRGERQYALFQNLAALAGSSNKFKRSRVTQFRMSKKNEDIMIAGRNVRNKRA